MPGPTGNEYADSVFRSLSLDEKIMQLYVFDARKRQADFFENPPSGIFFPAESFFISWSRISFEEMERSM